MCYFERRLLYVCLFNAPQTIFLLSADILSLTEKEEEGGGGGEGEEEEEERKKERKKRRGV